MRTLSESIRLPRRAQLVAAAALLLLSLTSACVTTASEGEAMRSDIERLKAESAAQKAAVAQDAQDRKAADDARAKKLDDALTQLNQATKKSGADLAVDVEKAHDEISQLRGSLEELTHRLQLLEQSAAERDKKLTDLSAQDAQARKQAAADAAPADKDQLYDLALRKLDGGDTAKSRELLTTYLARYPKDAKASLAQYWLGESYFLERRYNDAIVEFRKLLKAHKGSEKEPDAELRIGMAFQADGDCKNASLFYEDVLERFPKNGAARAARERKASCGKPRGRKK